MPQLKEKTIRVALSPDVHSALRHYAFDTQMTTAQIVDVALRAFLRDLAASKADLRTILGNEETK